MTMVVVDIMDDATLQQITKQSNMFDIGRDIINKVLNDSVTPSNNLDLNLLEDSVIFTPFTDNLPDLCTGFQFDFVIETRNINNCALPFV